MDKLTNQWLDAIAYDDYHEERFGRTKCILSLRVARRLLAKGHKLIDIEPSRKFKGQLVFVFEDNETLRHEMKKGR